MTTDDIAGLIAIVIRNNKAGVIKALNSTGNIVPDNISNIDLAVKLWDIFSSQGISGLQNVLSRVPPTDKLTEQEAKALVTKFRGVDPNTKFGDWLKGVGQYFGDLIGGSVVQGGTVTNMTSESVLSPLAMGLTVIGGLIGIAIFRKITAAVIAIAFIVVAVLLYGIFAKNIVTTQTGGGTVSHGGIGQVVLSWLTGKF